MLYLSQLIGRPVRDQGGDPIGSVADLIVAVGERYPPVTGLVVAAARRQIFLPWTSVESIDVAGARLRTSTLDLAKFSQRPNEILLKLDLMDKQIVDIDGRRVVRVNDLSLDVVEGSLRLVAVDVGASGLLRRLGIEGSMRRLARRLGIALHERYIDWEDVDPVESSIASVKLRVPHAGLAELHPADLAEIIDQLTPQDRAGVLASLDNEAVADAIEEMEPETQVEVLEDLHPDRAADILEEMSPDDAADLVADLPDTTREEILARMEQEEAAEVQELLSYPEESAGGIMTTEFIAVPATLTAAQAIDRLRELEPDAETIYYVYVVDEEEKLVGVLSLARPDRGQAGHRHPRRDDRRAHHRPRPRRPGPCRRRHRPLQPAGRPGHRRRRPPRGHRHRRRRARCGRAGGRPAAAAACRCPLAAPFRAAWGDAPASRPPWPSWGRASSPASPTTTPAASPPTRSPVRASATTCCGCCLLTQVALFVTQEVGARMGLATGQGLTGLIRERFGVRWAAFAALTMLFANLGTTVSEFAGIAAALSLFGVPVPVGAVLAAAAVIALIGLGSFSRVQLIFVGIGVLVSVAYIVSAALAHPDWAQAAQGLIPHGPFSGIYLLTVVGVVGTTITPWGQGFIQAYVVDKRLRPEDMGVERVDVLIGSTIANVVGAFIMIACAATLWASGQRDIKSAADAANALAPIAGDGAAALFGIGILAASLLGLGVVPLSSAYTATEAFGWERGVDWRWREAPAFYSLLAFFIAFAALFMLIPGLPLIQVMLGAQVINGLLLPVILIFVMRMAGDRRIMGNLASGRLSLALGWTVTGVLIAMSLTLVVTTVAG